MNILIKHVVAALEKEVLKISNKGNLFVNVFSNGSVTTIL